MTDSSRNEILSKLKNAPPFSWEEPLLQKDDNEPYFKITNDPLQQFCSELKDIGGEVDIYNNIGEIAEKIKQLKQTKQWESICCLDKNIKKDLNAYGLHTQNKLTPTVAISGCEGLVASTGSIIVSSNSGPGRAIYVYPEVLIIIAHHKDLHFSFSTAMQQIKTSIAARPSWIGLITGPSRTADIEKTLVIGAHGPKRLIVLINQNNNK